MALQTVTVPVRNLDAIRSGKENATSMTAMQTMASKMWKVLLVMGFMIVAVSFIIGIFNGIAIGEFFGETKAVREASPNYENFGTVQAVVAWLPGFKLFGVGLMLGGITMTLATILGNLRVAGANVQAALGAEVKLPIPPTIAKVFPLMMMMGVMTLLAVFGIGVWLSGLAGDVYGNAISDVSAAPAGSALLADIGTINAVKAWLTPMEFLGMAFLFTGITLALATIVTVLRFQASRLVEIAAEKTA
ncbi:MAG: hypothetical protein HQ478_05990 [Chloroflexi bacterium]|nr:hypothetical protein [Chloroflexota bacterium]